MKPAEIAGNPRILEDIAREFLGNATFPTCLDAAMMVRDLLRDPDVTLEKVAQHIGIEPLIAGKLLRLANAVPYNPSGRPVTELKTAIVRLGFEAVRTVALAVVMEQMLRTREAPAVSAASRMLWENSLHVAAIARLLARQHGGVHPEEAMLAGLVEKMGVFYLLYRAAEYPIYTHDPAALEQLLADGGYRWICECILEALGLPTVILRMIRDQSGVGGLSGPPRPEQILNLANRLAPATPVWMQPPGVGILGEAEREPYLPLLEQAARDVEELRTALSA